MAMQIESRERITEPEPSHYEESSAREKLVEHVFLGELLRRLWRKNVRDLEVLRPEVDSGGYDFALEYRGLTRHVQLKSSHRHAKRAAITANVKLPYRPSACILWIYFDPDTMGPAVGEIMAATEALLFGRRTWQAMAAAWPDRAGRRSP